MLASLNRRGLYMKVLLINGSPHKEGNTYLALKECADVLHNEGIETEIFWIGNKPVRGCIGCGQCYKVKHCVFEDDNLNELVSKMKEADAYVVGSPVYYAGPNGALCALLDRAFYSSGKDFKYKPASAVCVCRRSGGSATLDRLTKYFTINQMPVISSTYWNIAHGAEIGEVVEDLEGMQTMRYLGYNMAAYLKKESDVKFEKRVFTNFVR